MLLTFFPFLDFSLAGTRPFIIIVTLLQSCIIRLQHMGEIRKILEWVPMILLSRASKCSLGSWPGMFIWNGGLHLIVVLPSSLDVCSSLLSWLLLNDAHEALGRCYLLDVELVNKQVDVDKALYFDRVDAI